MLCNDLFLRIFLRFERYDPWPDVKLLVTIASGISADVNHWLAFYTKSGKLVAYSGHASGETQRAMKSGGTVPAKTKRQGSARSQRTIGGVIKALVRIGDEMKIEYVSGSNVVSLMPRRNDMHFPALKTVEAYWDGLRNGRPVPARSEIDPRGMQSALEYAFILERIALGVARFRLAGMHLTDLMGMEVRGMPLTAMFVPESRAKISEALEAVFETPQITVITLKAERGIGRGVMDAQLLLCPLKSDLGDVNRVLGCLQSKGEIGRQPRRFEVVDVQSRPLLSDNPTEQSFATTPAGTPVPAGFAEAKKAYDDHAAKDAGKNEAKPHASMPQRPKGKPVLRLIKAETHKT
jgi:hypothetical protein